MLTTGCWGQWESRLKDQLDYERKYMINHRNYQFVILVIVPLYRPIEWHYINVHTQVTFWILSTSCLQYLADLLYFLPVNVDILFRVIFTITYMKLCVEEIPEREWSTYRNRDVVKENSKTTHHYKTQLYSLIVNFKLHNARTK